MESTAEDTAELPIPVDTTPRILSGHDWDAYRAIPFMNPSTLVEGIRSMKHLRMAIDGGTRYETNGMRLGTGIHALTLEPDEFRDRFVVMPEYNLDDFNTTKDGKPSKSTATEYYRRKVREWHENLGGKISLSQSQYDNAMAAVEAINGHDEASEIIRTHDKEQTVIGVIAGIPFKGRVDLLRRSRSIVDVKTTASCDPYLFGGVCARLHYAFKMSIYRELVRQVTGKVLDVRIIAQEVSGAFDTVVYDMAAIHLDNAFSRVLKVIDDYKLCLLSDRWPGVDGGDRSIPLPVPNWSMNENDDNEAFDWNA